MIPGTLLAVLFALWGIYGRLEQWPKRSSAAMFTLSLAAFGFTLIMGLVIMVRDFIAWLA